MNAPQTPSSMRCFIGAKLDPQSTSILSKCCPDLLDLRPVDPEKYHVTLKFLGNLAPPEISRWQDQVADWRVAFPIECSVRWLTGFPNPRRARTIAVTIDSDGKLEQLRPDDPLFRPHVTLGRMKKRKFASFPPQALVLKFVLRQIALYESAKGRYTEIASEPSR